MSSPDDPLATGSGPVVSSPSPMIDQDPAPGLYEHYKGGLYLVLGTAGRSEDRAARDVVYFSLAKRVWWVRPLPMFVEWVRPEAGDPAPVVISRSAGAVPRFRPVGPSGAAALLWGRLRRAIVRF